MTDRGRRIEPADGFAVSSASDGMLDGLLDRLEAAQAPKDGELSLQEAGALADLYGRLQANLAKMKEVLPDEGEGPQLRHYLEASLRLMQAFRSGLRQRPDLARFIA